MGVAAPLPAEHGPDSSAEPLTALAGRAFVFLPLPLATGLPAHVNGCFELSRCRFSYGVLKATIPSVPSPFRTVVLGSPYGTAARKFEAWRQDLHIVSAVKTISMQPPHVAHPEDHCRLWSANVSAVGERLSS